MTFTWRRSGAHPTSTRNPAGPAGRPPPPRPARAGPLGGDAGDQHAQLGAARDDALGLDEVHQHVGQHGPGADDGRLQGRAGDRVHDQHAGCGGGGEPGVGQGEPQGVQVADEAAVHHGDAPARGCRGDPLAQLVGSGGPDDVVAQ
ncbi:hypothetical protein ACFW9F_09505 [Streptomyces sp. NPDC059506]|uniref:hypothetical protein n=1 Tax=Streptomyces sp. NPDC059506 TaxID=3347751 RepID=UPI0036934821